MWCLEATLLPPKPNKIDSAFGDRKEKNEEQKREGEEIKNGKSKKSWAQIKKTIYYLWIKNVVEYAQVLIGLTIFASLSLLGTIIQDDLHEKKIIWKFVTVPVKMEK